MERKTVLITGASSGFGRLLVTAFLRAGWIVVASMRKADERAGEFAAESSTAPERFFTLSLDVVSESDRVTASEFIERRFAGRLDCLINNAGMGIFGALEDLTEQQLRAQMEVNFFGLAFLTRELLPCLRRARGRVINISSVLGYTGMPLTSPYCASKFAVEGLSEAMYYELRPLGVQVALVEPGAFRTSFSANQQWGENSSAADSPYHQQSRSFREFRERRAEGPGNPPDPVINAVMRLSTMAGMPLRVRCGRDARLVYMLKRLLPEKLYTALLSAAYRRMFGNLRQE